MNKVCIASFGEMMLRLSQKANLPLAQVLSGDYGHVDDVGALMKRNVSGRVKR